MEAHEIIATATGIGGGGASGIVAYLARRYVINMIDTVEQILKDLKGLSKKIEDTKADLKSEICSVEKDIAAMSERIKSLENRK